MKGYGYYTCKKCGVSKPLTPQYFHRSPRNRTGFHHLCAACRKIYAREYYGSPKHADKPRKLYKGPPQRERLLEHKKKYLLDPEIKKDYLKYQKKYRSLPGYKEKMRAWVNDRFTNDPEYRKKRLAYSREYNRRHAAKLTEYNRAWRAENRERIREKAKNNYLRKKAERSKL